MFGHVQLVQGAVEAKLSVWTDCRQGLCSKSRAESAQNVLSIWMHLKRFHPKLLDPAIVSHINHVIRQDKRELLETALECEVLQGFKEKADKLTELINSHADLVDFEPSPGKGSLGDFLAELLWTLDDYVLFTAALDLLLEAGPQYAVQQKRVLEHVNAAREACSYFNSHADNFSWLWPMVIRMLDTFQMDMVKQDARVIATVMHLWHIKLEHDRTLGETLL